jgi:hypothetical protein
LCFGVSIITGGAEFGVVSECRQVLNLSAESSTDTPHATSRPSLRARTIIGLKLLGAPIGILEFCSGVLQKTVAKVSQAHNLLPEMDDPQVELLLLRAYLGSEKMTYLNRVIPTHTVLPHATSFDEAMRACLARITQGNISDAAWSQAGLPLHWVDWD